jgi:hypothetical protein
MDGLKELSRRDLRQIRGGLDVAKLRRHAVTVSVPHDARTETSRAPNISPDPRGD